MMFAAVPLEEVQKQILEEMPEAMDDWGYVHGYYVDGYIVGSIEEVTDEYLVLEWWIPVNKDTLLTEEELAEAVAVWEDEEAEAFYDDTYPCGCCTCCGCICDFEYEDMWIDEDWEDE